MTSIIEDGNGYSHYSSWNIKGTEESCHKKGNKIKKIRNKGEKGEMKFHRKVIKDCDSKIQLFW